MSEIPSNIHFIRALPRMQLYIEYAADIYSIFLDYFDPQDIHVYSIDESFIDVTDYLKILKLTARQLAKKLMNEIANRKQIPSTVGIGTNLFLAKVALDITAKHSNDHIGYLDEETFRATLWKHRPITDFWQIATGTANRLKQLAIYDMEGVAKCPPELLYKKFGINAELLIDHAWGREPCLIEDIKNYKGKSKSVSFSQVLPRDYTYDEARLVLSEMVLNGCQEMMRRHVITNKVGIFVGYTFGGQEPTGGSIRMTVQVVVNIYTTQRMQLVCKRRSIVDTRLAQNAIRQGLRVAVQQRRHQDQRMTTHQKKNLWCGRGLSASVEQEQ